MLEISIHAFCYFIVAVISYMFGKYNEMQSWIIMNHKIARKIIEITEIEIEKAKEKINE